MKYGTCPSHVDLPAVVVHAVVVAAAQQDPVAQVGGPAVGVPPADVMRFGIGRRMRATRPGAPAVPFGQRPPLRGAEQAAGAAQVEDFAVRAEDDGDDAGVGGHPPHGAGADRGGDPVDLRRADPGAQFVQADPDHARSPAATRPPRCGRSRRHAGTPPRRRRSAAGRACAVSASSSASASGRSVTVGVGHGERLGRGTRVVAEPHRAQVGGDDRVDGGHHVAGGFRVEEPVDPGHPIRGGGDGQGPAAALPGFPRFDAVLIQPVPHLPGQRRATRARSGRGRARPAPVPHRAGPRAGTGRRLWTVRGRSPPPAPPTPSRPCRSVTCPPSASGDGARCRGGQRRESWRQHLPGQAQPGARSPHPHCSTAWPCRARPATAPPAPPPR